MADASDAFLQSLPPDQQEALRALQEQITGAAAAKGAPAISPREAMLHYQALINKDPDYAPEKNPGARNPRYADAPIGPKSVRQPRNTEVERYSERNIPKGSPGRDEKNRLKALPYVQKQRSTKKVPVPRGTVGDKTEALGDIIMKLMGGGSGFGTPFARGDIPRDLGY